MVEEFGLRGLPHRSSVSPYFFSSPTHFSKNTSPLKIERMSTSAYQPHNVKTFNFIIYFFYLKII